MDVVHVTRRAPTPVQPETTEMIQQMIISVFSALGSFSTSSPWSFDSRASHHITNNANFLTNINKYSGNLNIYTYDGNSSPIMATVMFLLL